MVVYLRLCLHETQEILLQMRLQFNVEGLEYKNLSSTLVINHVRLGKTVNFSKYSFSLKTEIFALPTLDGL